MGPFPVRNRPQELEQDAKQLSAGLGQDGSTESLLKRVRSRGGFLRTPGQFIETVKRKEDAGAESLCLRALFPQNGGDGRDPRRGLEESSPVHAGAGRAATALR